jgi:hypothetical protein
MTYATIDSIIDGWTTRHGLELFTSYHDTEVRTVFLEGSEEERSQIWIDAPDSGQDITVHVAVYRKRGRDNQKTELSATPETLDSVLDQAYDTATDWLRRK